MGKVGASLKWIFEGFSRLKRVTTWTVGAVQLSRRGKATTHLIYSTGLVLWFIIPIDDAVRSRSRRATEYKHFRGDS